MSVLGDLDLEVLRAAMVLMVERHQVLSMRFENRNGSFFQIPEEHLKTMLQDVKIQDIRELQPGSDGAVAEIAHQLLAAEVSSPFNLIKGPPVHVLLLQVIPSSILHFRLCTFDSI